MLNLDSHMVLHATTGDLTGREKALLREHRWTISSIVIWEIGRLHELGRIEISLDHPLLAVAFDRLHVWDISKEVVPQYAPA